jgi:hypothetical protein
MGGRKKKIKSGKPGIRMKRMMQVILKRMDPINKSLTQYIK